MTDQPRIKSIQLKDGEPTVLEINRPVKFHITFTRGTTIEGIILPNSGFTICSRGDILKFDIVIDDDSTRKLGLVGDNEPSSGS